MRGSQPASCLLRPVQGRQRQGHKLKGCRNLSVLHEGRSHDYGGGWSPFAPAAP